MSNNPAPQINEEHLPTSPQELMDVLGDIGVEFTLYEHEPVFTVEESQKIDKGIDGTACRNLFLRDKKKRMFLVVVPHETPVDLKALEGKLECGRLSFGSADRLWQYLGVRPGSVCPFSVINDKANEIQVVLDADMMQSDLVCYHPLLNSMTISLTPADLLKFFEHTGHSPITIDLN